MPRGSRKAAQRVERPNGPDFEGAAKLLRESIGGLRDEGRSIQGDLSAAWKRIENETGVHKAAAKAIMALVGKSEDYASDFLRTFDGLRAVFKLGGEPDLVDLADSGDGDDGDGEGE